MTSAERRGIATEVAGILQQNGLAKDEIIGIDEVAKILGVSVKTVRNNIKKIPHTKVFGRLRFFRSSIYQMLQQ